MRNWFWLVGSLALSAPAAAQGLLPARVEIQYELKRNGSTMAEEESECAEEFG